MTRIQSSGGGSCLDRWWIDEPRVVASANPTLDELQALFEAGYRTIVCLLDHGGADGTKVEQPAYDPSKAEACINNDGEKHRSLFPLDYLGRFIKRVKDEELRIRLGTDYPMRVDWEGATQGTYLLSPRVEA